MNDIILIPLPEPKESSQLQVSKPTQNKEAVIIILPLDQRLPVPHKDIPVGKWIMPPEQHGYIQPNDRDCL